MSLFLYTKGITSWGLWRLKLETSTHVLKSMIITLNVEHLSLLIFLFMGKNNFEVKPVELSTKICGMLIY